MTDKQFQGVYAAALSPRLEDGRLDLESLRALIAFLRDRGVTRYAINGATGEFCLTTPEELRQLLIAVRTVGGQNTEILCGVGAAGLAGCMALVRVAEEANVQGLLLPMPYFFPYSQGDLQVFSRTVASATRLPILLYNLPQFTSGLEPETVCSLIEEAPSIVGIKDSSGSLDIVRALTERLPSSCRIMGNDSVLTEALADSLCDGVVSGVACVLPELICAHFRSVPGTEQFKEQEAKLNQFIEQLNVFPTPWGLKWAAEARGVLQARFSLPQSDVRKEQARALQAWLQAWLPEADTAS